MKRDGKSCMIGQARKARKTKRKDHTQTRRHRQTQTERLTSCPSVATPKYCVAEEQE